MIVNASLIGDCFSQTDNLMELGSLQSAER